MGKIWKRAWTLGLPCLICTVALLLLHLADFVFLAKLERFSLDWRLQHGRKPEVLSQLVFLGITEPGYGDNLSAEEKAAEPVLEKMAGQFPWPREVWAALIDRLAEAGAKVIAVDLLFATPGPGDEALRNALEKHRGRVVIAANLTGGKTMEQHSFGESLVRNFPTATVLPTMAESETAQTRDDRVGFINVWPDGDDVVRRARFRFQDIEGGAVLTTLAARVLEKMGRRDAIPADAGAVGFKYCRASGYGYPAIPVYYPFIDKIWTTRFQSGRFFRDKVVLIGPAANVFQDLHSTPFEGDEHATKAMLGPEIHLNIIGAALQGAFWRSVPLPCEIGLILGLGLLSWLVNLPASRVWRRLLTVLILGGFYLYASQAAFDQVGLAIPVATPMLTLVLASLMALAYDFVLERRERVRLRRTLERYVSRDVVRELLDNPQSFLNSLGGVRKPVTILFSDVRGFTTLTEGANAEQLVAQLNEYFEEMVRIVFKHQGRLDKFIGDAVMADWGSILSAGPADDAVRAVATGLEMRESLKNLNADWAARGMLQLAFGIGINHGEVIIGNLGSSQKMEVSVIGDPVNLASRLEGVTKEYHLDLVIGESVAHLVQGHYVLRPVDLIQVKGKTRPVEVFAVLGAGNEANAAPVWLARYVTAIGHYRQRAFARAQEEFEGCLGEAPDDYLNQMYRQRCQFYLENPPGPEWNGVHVMMGK
jgi:adenylate cyclase